MHEKDNYLKTAELSTEQNCNMIDGVPNCIRRWRVAAGAVASGHSAA